MFVKIKGGIPLLKKREGGVGEEIELLNQMTIYLTLLLYSDADSQKIKVQLAY